MTNRASNESVAVCVVGRFPPPLGGVSVYCSRRYAMLRRQSSGTRKIDFSERAWPLRLLFSRKVDYEVNTLNLGYLAVHFLLGKMGRSVVIDHNASRRIDGWRKRMLLFLLRGARGIRVVNRALQAFYPAEFETRVMVPFVPPDPDELPSVIATYPDDVRDFIDSGAFLVNSAWRYTPYEQSDLYGLADSLALLDTVPGARLLLAVGDSRGLPAQLRASIEQHVAAGRLCLLEGQRQLWPVFTKDAVCLRLTPVDGDSVTVREALHFGCPVIASDAVERPDGCELYHYGDFDDLSGRVRRLYEARRPDSEQ